MTAEPHGRTLAELRSEAAGCTGCDLHARALLGPGFRVTQQRGQPVALDGRTAVATVHPSAVLRIQDSEQRAVERHRLVEDLAVVARRLGTSG